MGLCLPLTQPKCSDWITERFSEVIDIKHHGELQKYALTNNLAIVGFPQTETGMNNYCDHRLSQRWNCNLCSCHPSVITRPFHTLTPFTPVGKVAVNALYYSTEQKPTNQTWAYQQNTLQHRMWLAWTAAWTHEATNEMAVLNSKRKCTDRYFSTAC